MLLSAPQGSTIASISDGTSKTFLVIETKEPYYCSWYDGTVNWVVTNWPNPTGGTGNPPGTAPSGGTGPNVAPWSGGSVTNAISLNQGGPPTSQSPSQLPYMSPGGSVGLKCPMMWGPSSDHPGGLTMHLYCDGHTDSVSDNCDPGVYLSLTTRAGGEAADPSGL